MVAINLKDLLKRDYIVKNKEDLNYDDEIGFYIQNMI